MTWFPPGGRLKAKRRRWSVAQYTAKWWLLSTGAVSDKSLQAFKEGLDDSSLTASLLKNPLKVIAYLDASSGLEKSWSHKLLEGVWEGCNYRIFRPFTEHSVLPTIRGRVLG